MKRSEVDPTLVAAASYLTHFTDKELIKIVKLVKELRPIIKSWSRYKK